MCFNLSKTTIVIPLVVLTYATLAVSQTPGEAFLAYERGEYEKSAAIFYRVLENKSTSLAKDEAEYGLAMSLLQAKYYLAALKHFEQIVAKGEEHAYFVRAVEGMLDATVNAGGEVLIAQLLDGLYDKSIGALGKVRPAVVQHIHFMIANRAFRSGQEQESIDFARTIERHHQDYARAQYMMGLGILKAKVAGQKPDYATVLGHFENVRRVPSEKTDDRLQNLKSLSTLATARIYYEMAYASDNDKERQSLMEKSIQEYQAIPRFTSLWPDALFERAWAYTVVENYGDALGSLYSLQHPYFANTFYPEADVLKAIVYWYNCQWDKVEQTLAEFNSSYGALAAPLKALQSKNIDDADWNGLLQSSEMPKKVALRMMQDRQYDVFNSLFQQIERERVSFLYSPQLKDTPFARDVMQYLDASRDDLKKTVGRWIKNNIKHSAAEIDDMTTRAGIISLETKTAQAKWLEQGRQIEGQMRPRLARPFVAQDGHEFWWDSHRERWIDELGYHRYFIQSECYE